MYLNLVPSGPDIEVVVHDNGTPDSDASGPVDIILVDETHSAVVHHTTPDGDNDVGADGEDSMPTFTIPPRTPSIDPLALHHKRASKRRSRASQFSLAPNGTVSLAHSGFTSFHTPVSSFSDGHEPHHSALSSPLSRSCSPSVVVLPAFHDHRPCRLLSASASAMSTSTSTSIAQSRQSNTPMTYTPMLAQAKAARPARAGPSYFSPRRKRAQACRRYSPTSLVASSCAGNGKRKRFT